MSLPKSNTYDRPRAYLAAPLFSVAERGFNLSISQELETFMDVYLPQRDGGLMSEMLASGVPSEIAAKRVFNLDMVAIRDADYIIAVLDGRAIDEGVAFELGVACAHGKQCVAIQTDSRRLAPWGNNPMITGSLDQLFISVDALIQWAASRRTVGTRATVIGQ